MGLAIFDWEEAGKAELRSLAGGSDLFAEDFLHVADFTLNLAAGFFQGPAIFQIAVTGCSAGGLFNFAFGFLDPALDFVFRARFHNEESSGTGSWDGGAELSRKN